LASGGKIWTGTVGGAWGSDRNEFGRIRLGGGWESIFSYRSPIMPKAPSPTAAAQEEHTLWNSFKVYVFFLNNIHYGIVLKKTMHFLPPP
jgi:hypothetical protein